MKTFYPQTLQLEKNQEQTIPNMVLGILFLITTEIMFFAGIISAFIVNKAGMEWPPEGQPRLPAEVTGINTLILLVSGGTLYFAIKSFKKNSLKLSKYLLFASIFFGGMFLIVQGKEWIKLIGFGLTTTSSIYGAFFYFIIGTHGVHALAGLFLLVYLFFKVKNIKSIQMDFLEKFSAFSLFWSFVVCIWPVLYWLVYLN